MAHALTETPARAILRVRPLVDASSAMADPAAIAALAAANGYLFFRRLVERDGVLALRDRVLDLCAHRGWLDEAAPRARGVARENIAGIATRDELLAIQAGIQALPEFAKLRSHPAILAVLESIFGAAPTAGYGDVCRLSFAGDLERTTPPHQDYFYTRGSTSLWTAWIPLGDCPGRLGGLAVIPASHASGLWPHEGGDGEARFIPLDDDAPWVGASYRAGDVLLLSALTVHGARPNVSDDRIRLSIDCRYQPSST
ncbi:MAG: phytanoyl-CoA dioxygenase family protein [Gemmatimonadaceae bacterium]